MLQWTHFPYPQAVFNWQVNKCQPFKVDQNTKRYCRDSRNTNIIIVEHRNRFLKPCSSFSVSHVILDKIKLGLFGFSFLHLLPILETVIFSASHYIQYESLLKLSSLSDRAEWALSQIPLCQNGIHSIVYPLNFRDFFVETCKIKSATFVVHNLP